MSAPHGDREHATWSASASARLWACAGSLTLAELHPEKGENAAAAWGTACHQIAEKALTGKADLDDLLDTVEKTKEHSIVVDEEMIDCARMYVDYVLTALANAREAPAVGLYEQRFSLAKLDPPFDAGGTGDAVMYFPADKLLEIVDLKGGRGVVVEALGNKQMRTYALGALLAFPQYDVERVKVTIVQPRAPHKDGRIRSETFHVMDLIEWGADLRRAMKGAYEAKVAYKTMTEMAWAEMFLVAGQHCHDGFCPARAQCPRLRQDSLDAARVWFDDLDQPHVGNQPQGMTPEELAKTLDLLDMIDSWSDAVRHHAKAQAEIGVEVPGYTLVEKIGRRAWLVDEAAVVKAVREGGYEGPVHGKPKLMSPAQLEKALGAKKKHLVAALNKAPVTGTSLVRKDKTSRPTVAPAVMFDVLE